MHIKTKHSIGDLVWVMQNNTPKILKIARIETFTGPTEDSKTLSTKITYSYTEDYRDGSVKWWFVDEKHVYPSKAELLASL